MPKGVREQKTLQTLLYGKIIAVCFDILTEHKNTLFGQSVEFLDVKSGGTYSNH
jgi:hypothetical protein